MLICFLVKEESGPEREIMSSILRSILAKYIS
jgi:hypothetical protein